MKPWAFVVTCIISLLIFLAPFPIRPFSTGGDWYQPSSGPDMGGKWVQSPVYTYFEPWGIDTILIKCIVILVIWIALYSIVSPSKE